MHWVIIITVVYLTTLVLVCLRIMYETYNASKAMAYLLLCIFVPVFGILFYVAFGINYWRQKKYNKKREMDKDMLDMLKKKVPHYNTERIAISDINEAQNAELAFMLIDELGSPLTRNNQVKLLINGEEKFPELLEAMDAATHHIHLEYYIFEQDDTGNAVLDMMMKKAAQGLKVRFLYDDFGSASINNKLMKKLTAAGVELHPFHKVHFYLLANRINYRNHRKIVIIDGHTAFVGGINVSDRYVNSAGSTRFWRDTHIRIDGSATYYLQFLFITDWNFSQDEKLLPDSDYFTQSKTKGNQYVQIAASGPDSPQPTLLFSLLQAIYLAKKEILLTTPYFIPGESIVNALCVSALSGLSVKVLVPGISDSRLVNAASRSNYTQLLKAGVEIYFYRKGFIHAKTLVADGKLAVVGTANMDHRSFELNFEVNALIYDEAFAAQLKDVFNADLEDAALVDIKKWLHRSLFRQLPERIARLFSPVL